MDDPQPERSSRTCLCSSQGPFSHRLLTDVQPTAFWDLPLRCAAAITALLWHGRMFPLAIDRPLVNVDSVALDPATTAVELRR